MLILNICENNYLNIHISLNTNYLLFMNLLIFLIMCTNNCIPVDCYAVVIPFNEFALLILQYLHERVNIYSGRDLDLHLFIIAYNNIILFNASQTKCMLKKYKTHSTLFDKDVQFKRIPISFVDKC